MWNKLIIGSVAAAATAIGGTGVAVAATQQGVPAASAPAASAQLAASGGTGGGALGAWLRGRHFTCAQAPKVLARIQKLESDIQAGLPKLNAAEQKAKAAGNTARADRIEKLITRLESSTFQQHLTTVTQKIEAKCGSGTSTTGSGSGSTSGGSGTGTGSTGSTASAVTA